MAKLTRITGKLFGETATATGDDPQIGQFGSALAGTYVGTTDVATIQNLTAWSNGFIGSVTPTDNFPPLPEMTGFGKVLSYQQNYLLQQGIAEWDSATTYYTNSYCSYNGTVYVSLSDNNTNNNPASTPASWAVYGNTIFADKNLSNLSSTGESRLHALKSYEDAGELLTDTEGLADVTAYAHSTFDSTKFTKVGSPIVTDDGIASGFSTSNRISPNYILTDTNKAWEIKCKFTMGADATAYGNIFSFQKALSNVGRYGLLFYTESAKLKLTTTFDGNSFATGISGVAGSNTLTANSTYYCKVGWDTATYYVDCSTDGATYERVINVASTTATYNGFTAANFGMRYNTDYIDIFNGQIDLKQLSITVDGVPVFSGNQTGIDTIKPDDYTIVGTPSISADGVASGFSSSNYLRTAILDTSKNFEIYCRITSGLNTSTKNSIFAIEGSGRLFCLNIQNNKFGLYASSDGSNWTINGTEFGSITANTAYYLRVKSNNGALSIEEFANNTWTSIFNQTFTLHAETNRYLVLGVERGHSEPFLGSIDLNAFKIYVDGNLVYQPCLKIPYTLSKTGSKVVDSYYRPRVTDMAEQFGSAPYYTLSDSDYTLPQGELYGFYEKSAYYYLPDWENRILIKTTTLGTDVVSSYTAPENGYISCDVETVTAGSLSASINNLQWWAVGGSTYNASGAIMIPVKKGDVYSEYLPTTAGALTAERYFIPTRGV